MASINATTSSGIVATADNTGQLQLQSAGTTIATISSTGLTMNSGNIVQASGAAPAFAAYQLNGSANQSVSSDTWTKARIDTEEYDTANCFDTTNYRFTPNVAGYYQINGCLYLRNAAASLLKIVGIYKNGSLYKQGVGIYLTGNYYTAADTFPVSTLVYLNGTTDYVELWGYISSSAASFVSFSNLSAAALASRASISACSASVASRSTNVSVAPS